MLEVSAAERLRRHERCRRELGKFPGTEVATEAQEEGQGLEEGGAAQKYTYHRVQSKDR